MSAVGHAQWAASADDLLALARARGVLSPLDQQFASRLGALYEEASEGVRWALAIACRQEAAGHVCADLPRLAERGLVGEVAGVTTTWSLLATHPSLEAWLDEIAESPLVGRVAGVALAPIDSQAPRPLLLDPRGRLYLRRAFESQRMLAAALLERARARDLAVDWDLARDGIERLVGGQGEDDTAPRDALRAGLVRPLSIVTGGPGTGKTTMVARLIALLIEQALAAGKAAPRVRLLAPTGRAAAAMASSFARQRASLDVAPEVLAALPTTAETVHRATYRQTRRDAFGRPLELAFEQDVVVVDEASMVDLSLMTRMFRACASVGRVVLLGDPEQLTSVDSGAVLAELCGGVDRGAAGRDLESSSQRGLADSIVTLRTSHRFSDAGGIGRLAEAIRVGDADGALALLADGGAPEVERYDARSIDDVRTRLVEESRRMHREIEGADSHHAKLDRMGLYRVLCTHRRGPLGVEALCVLLDEIGAAERKTTSRSGWWLGRMLLVTHNAPDQDLWNGDVGLVEQTGAGLRALFPDAAGGVRALSAGRLPAYESAIAMSVHKSQGSEFEVVDLVLGDVASPLMTRELLYTGVTRARKRLRLHASEGVVRAAIGRRIERDSALSELLWAE